MYLKLPFRTGRNPAVPCRIPYHWSATVKCSRWSELDWLEKLVGRARRHIACDADAEDLAHDCLYAYHKYFEIFPWEAQDPVYAWRWCCQKLQSLCIDYARRASRCLQVSFDNLAEDAIVVKTEAEALETIIGEAFLNALPLGQQKALNLRLEGYSWEETAQILGKRPNTLRSYLPRLKVKFCQFFGYDPSKQLSQSLIRTEGQEEPCTTTLLGGQNHDERSKRNATDSGTPSETDGGAEEESAF